MILDISGHRVFAWLDYAIAHDRLVLRTDGALLTPDDTRTLSVRLAEASDFELELLRVAGYGCLTSAITVP